MKRKGITIWEQHLERFVVGAAVLFFIAFTVLQFLGDPNSVDKPGVGKVSPGEIDDLLSQAAVDLQSRLAPGAPAALEIPDHEPVLDRFNAMIVSSVSPSPTIDPGGARRVVIAETLETQTGVAYHEPEITAPTAVVFDQHFDAVVPEEVQAYEELQERWPDAPYDVTWVTAAALFDVKGVLDEFRKDGPDDRKAIPQTWFHDRVDVLDVRVEREEYVDGAWTNLTVLDVLPGQISLRERLAEGVDKSVRDDIQQELVDEGFRSGIYQPTFYTTNNDSWTPPNPRLGDEEEDPAMSDAERAIQSLRRKIQKAVGEEEQYIERIERLGGSMPAEKKGGSKEEEKPPPAPPKGREGERGGRAPGGIGGSGGGQDRREQPKEKRRAPGSGGFGLGGEGGTVERGAQRNEATIKRLVAKVTSLRRKIARWERDLDTMFREAGLDPDGLDVAAKAETGEIIIWAHDLTVKSGNTYRYRMTVEVYNPFYARKLSLLEEQHALAEGMTIESKTSEWSRGKRVIPDRNVFITKAYRAGGRNSGQLGMGQATAEVYSFYNGRWWLETFSVQPGDRIGSMQSVRRQDGDPLDIDFGTDWFVLDIVEDIDVEKTDEEAGRGAMVVLQKVSADGETRVGDPNAATRDREREQLKDAVEDADAPEEVAARDP